MKPTKTPLKEIINNVEALREGMYSYRGIKIHVAKMNQPMNCRVKKIYNRRRDAGQCIRCGKKVHKINQRTKQPLRMCIAHR